MPMSRSMRSSRLASDCMARRAASSARILQPGAGVPPAAAVKSERGPCGIAASGRSAEGPEGPIAAESHEPEHDVSFGRRRARPVHGRIVGKSRHHGGPSAAARILAKSRRGGLQRYKACQVTRRMIIAPYVLFAGTTALPLAGVFKASRALHQSQLVIAVQHGCCTAPAARPSSARISPSSRKMPCL